MLYEDICRQHLKGNRGCPDNPRTRGIDQSCLDRPWPWSHWRRWMRQEEVLTEPQGGQDCSGQFDKWFHWQPSCLDAGLISHVFTRSVFSGWPSLSCPSICHYMPSNLEESTIGLDGSAQLYGGGNRVREVKWPAQVHVSSKCRRQDSNSDLLDSSPPSPGISAEKSET